MSARPLLIFSPVARSCCALRRAGTRTEQDLTSLVVPVEKYQMLRRPPGRNAPTTAATIHIVSARCTITTPYGRAVRVAGSTTPSHGSLQGRGRPRRVSYAGNKKRRLHEALLFEPGRTAVEHLTVVATDAELSPEAVAKDFMGGKKGDGSRSPRGMTLAIPRWRFGLTPRNIPIPRPGVSGGPSGRCLVNRNHLPNTADLIQPSYFPRRA